MLYLLCDEVCELVVGEVGGWYVVEWVCVLICGLDCCGCVYVVVEYVVCEILVVVGWWCCELCEWDDLCVVCGCDVVI